MMDYEEARRRVGVYLTQWLLDRKVLCPGYIPLIWRMTPAIELEISEGGKLIKEALGDGKGS